MSLHPWAVLKCFYFNFRLAPLPLPLPSRPLEEAADIPDCLVCCRHWEVWLDAYRVPVCCDSPLYRISRAVLLWSSNLTHYAEGPPPPSPPPPSPPPPSPPPPLPPPPSPPPPSPPPGRLWTTNKYIRLLCWVVEPAIVCQLMLVLV